MPATLTGRGGQVILTGQVRRASRGAAGNSLVENERIKVDLERLGSISAGYSSDGRTTTGGFAHDVAVIAPEAELGDTLGGGPVDVKDWGAKGDGITDDRDAIQAAIAAASAGNANTVYFPPSVTAYMLATPLVIPSNVTFWAYPGTATIKATATNAATTQLLDGTAGGVSNVLFYGLTFDGNILGQFQPGGALNKNRLASFIRSYGVVFDSVVFRDAAGTACQWSTQIQNCGVRNSRFINIGTRFRSTNSAADVNHTLNFLENNAVFTGSISGATLTVSAMQYAGFISNGSQLIGAGIPDNVTVIVNGTGGVGTYTISQALTVASGTIYSTARSLSAGNFVEDNVFIAIGGAGSNAYQQTGFSLQRNKFLLGSDAAFTASISGTTMTVTGGSSGFIRPGSYVYGVGLYPGTYITANGTGRGGAGTYTLNTSNGTVASQAMTTAGLDGTIKPSSQSFFANVGQVGPFVAGSRGTVLANNQSWVASEGSIAVAGGDNTVIVGNNGHLSGTYGIGISTGILYGHTLGMNNFTVSGNNIMGAGINYTTPGVSAGLMLLQSPPPSGTSIVGTGHTNGVISGNNFSDSQTTPTQNYSISVVGLGGAAAPTVTDVRVSRDNVTKGNILGPLNGISYSSGGVLNPQPVAPVGNGADMTEDTLQTFTIPANTLLNVGDRVRVLAAGTLAASTDQRVPRVRLGGTLLGQEVATSATATVWRVDADIMKTGSNTQTVIATGLATVTSATIFDAALTKADSGPLVLTVTGQNNTNSVAGSITCNYLTVEYFPA